MTVDYQTAASGNRVYLGLFGYVEGTADQRAAIRDLTVSGSVKAASESPSIPATWPAWWAMARVWMSPA